MTMKKKFSLIAALAVSALALSACSSAAPESQDGDAERTVKIVTSNDAPFSFVDESTGELTGIDGEMLGAMAEELNWKIEVVVTDFATMPQTVLSKKADFIADGLYVTDSRKETLAFSDTWYYQGEGMLVPADSTFTSRDDAKGKTVGVMTGTTHLEIAQELTDEAHIKQYDSQANLIQAIANGQVDAGFTDQAVVAWSLVQNPNDKVKLVSPYEPYFPGTIAAAFRQDADSDAMREELNGALANLKASPKYLEILQKYGLGEDNIAE
ncbi:substrate-binding periplasmic protein [Leucobacter aridicollis]|uniref:Polar amino acid transport system substrate-binding protein n=1 Tax=Leucobacter aridicollis TaxID=283878 RepID=A0A852R7P4_9MICO|nr:ABC transporter substrate-binding protein [Leucobacter aridicollis]MBL3681512.1 amino acid ABC transporter substrate-binding protein [Leucobacter aridicollis]NYD27455.1 polar amino acid transport system substrate-binding protein [Leucobacter aridicollis]